MTLFGAALAWPPLHLLLKGARARDAAAPAWGDLGFARKDNHHMQSRQCFMDLRQNPLTQFRLTWAVDQQNIWRRLDAQTRNIG